MNVLLFLVPIAIILGILAIAGFLWALQNNQFDDAEGSANRILFDDEDE